MVLNDSETATVLAALREFQSHLARDPSAAVSVHFDDAECLDDAEIDELCERINLVDDDEPALIAIKVKDGTVVETVVSVPATVVVLDYDVMLANVDTVRSCPELDGSAKEAYCFVDDPLVDGDYAQELVDICQDAQAPASDPKEGMLP